MCVVVMDYLGSACLGYGSTMAIHSYVPLGCCATTVVPVNELQQQYATVPMQSWEIWLAVHLKMLSFTAQSFQFKGFFPLTVICDARRWSLEVVMGWLERFWLDVGPCLLKRGLQNGTAYPAVVFICQPGSAGTCC